MEYIAGFNAKKIYLIIFNEVPCCIWIFNVLRNIIHVVTIDIYSVMAKIIFNAIFNTSSFSNELPTQACIDK